MPLNDSLQEAYKAKLETCENLQVNLIKHFKETKGGQPQVVVLNCKIKNESKTRTLLFLAHSLETLEEAIENYTGSLVETIEDIRVSKEPTDLNDYKKYFNPEGETEEV